MGKDHTLMVVGWLNLLTGESKVREPERVDFAKYSRFEHLPRAVQTDEVRAEFEAFKEWEATHAH